jgi:hypothetical protein
VFYRNYAALSSQDTFIKIPLLIIGVFKTLKLFPLFLGPNMKPKVRAREFPISAVRFIQEMGDGVFGKMYRGELGGIVGRFSIFT